MRMGIRVTKSSARVTCLVSLQTILTTRNATTVKNPKPVKTAMIAISAIEILKADMWLLRGGPVDPIQVEEGLNQDQLGITVYTWKHDHVHAQQKKGEASV